MTDLVSVLVDGIIYSSYLFIIAVGLTLIYGVMKILNMAHGSLYALGAYVTATLVGAWFGHGLNAYGSFVLLPLAAILVGLVAGPVIERGLLRFMYGKDEIVLILVTYAVLLILEDLIKLVWGVESYAAYQPYGLLGNFQVAGLPYTKYDAILVVVGVLVGAALTWVLTRTRQGKLLLAVIHDREVSAAMGINVQRVYLVTFTMGTMLAALGGALIAPKVSVVPAMG
ncbi:MAG: branched-chain amino acid ABC transporter permease, partial [Solimonas sp.]